MKRKVLDETTLLGYGHGDFFVEFLYSVIKKNFSIKEIPYIQKKDEDEGTKNSPNLIRFFFLGFLYFLDCNYKVPTKFDDEKIKYKKTLCNDCKG